MRFELVFKDIVKHFETYKAAKKNADCLNCPWQIFKIVESKVHLAIEEQELFGKDGIVGVVNDLAKGRTIQSLVRQHHISYPTLKRHLINYRNQNNENTLSLP